MQLVSVRFDFHSCNTEARSLVRCYVRSIGGTAYVHTYISTDTASRPRRLESSTSYLIFVFAKLSLMWLNFKSRHFKYREMKVTDTCALGNHKTTEPSTSVQVIRCIGNTAYVRTSYLAYLNSGTQGQREGNFGVDTTATKFH